jgi:hypothetical protein
VFASAGWTIPSLLFAFEVLARIWNPCNLWMMGSGESLEGWLVFQRQKALAICVRACLDVLAFSVTAAGKEAKECRTTASPRIFTASCDSASFSTYLPLCGFFAFHGTKFCSTRFFHMAMVFYVCSFRLTVRYPV